MAQNLTNILSTRVPNNISQIIREIAQEKDRKTGDIVREAIEMYISEWADYKIASDRLKNSADPILSENEFIKELGWDI
jgi:predicted DNA-binding protein